MANITDGDMKLHIKFNKRERESEQESVSACVWKTTGQVFFNETRPHRYNP
jgi:hypothetical protein